MSGCLCEEVGQTNSLFVFPSFVPGPSSRVTGVYTVLTQG